jgi:hypothetical protein
VRQKYDTVASAAPVYQSLPKSEFEHVRAAFTLATLPTEDTSDTGLTHSEEEDMFKRFVVGSDQYVQNFIENRTEYQLAGDDGNFEELDVSELEEMARLLEEDNGEDTE